LTRRQSISATFVKLRGLVAIYVVVPHTVNLKLMRILWVAIRFSAFDTAERQRILLKSEQIDR
jgi:hypothetical protein